MKISNHSDLLGDGLKRIFDIVISLMGLLILLPLFIGVAIALRLEAPGPVFYHARRVGRYGREFGMYKFRTMTTQQVANGPMVTAWDDPRITRLGRVLRQTKINELPQLINVLKGEMSIVGPRPEAPEFVAHYTDEEAMVLQAVPGITSLAAVIYSAEESLLTYANASDSYIRDIMPTKLRLDMLYVRRRSLLLDLDIIFRTMLAILPRIGHAAPDAETMLLGPIQRLARRHLSWFSLDLLAAFGAVGLAGLVWRTTGPLDLGWGMALFWGVVLATIFSFVNHLTGVQATLWRYANMSDMVDLVLSATVATVLLLVGNMLPGPHPTFPPGFLILAGIFAMAGFVIVRYRSRLVRGLARRIPLWSSGAGKERVLVIGSGKTGRMAVDLIRSAPASAMFHIVGLVDDALDKRGNRIHGLRVLGARKHIPYLVNKHDIGLVVLAIHNIEPHEFEEILQLCQSTPARVLVLPDVAAMFGPSPVRNGAHSAPNGQLSSPPLKQPQAGIRGNMVEAATVSAWMNELSRLARQGQIETFEQRVLEIQLSLGKGIVYKGHSLPVNGVIHEQAVSKPKSA